MNTTTKQLVETHNIKFKHNRIYNGNKLSAKGGVTFAISEEKGMSVCKVASAVCSKNDVFCKETGRSIAAARLAAGDYIWMPTTGTYYL